MNHVSLYLPSFSDQAIVLKRYNFGEADKLVTLFTRNHGKITTIAKGVRKPTSKKAGHLELFNHTKIFVAEGKNLGIITEAEVIDSFEGIKKDLQKVGQAFYVMELVNVLLAEGQKNYKVFELLLETLQKLDREGKRISGLDPVRLAGARNGAGIRELENAKTNSLIHYSTNQLLRSFEIKLLKILGFWSDEVFAQRYPKEPQSQARFNCILIEHIIEKTLKTPKFLEKLK